MNLFAHPFSSYCQKVLTALYENATPFNFRLVGPDAAIKAELQSYWPLGKFPVLVDEGRVLIESSIIIEHLNLRHPGPVPLLPQDPAEALEVRFMDRFFDNYIATPMQKIVSDFIRPAAERDAKGVADAHTALATAYAWLDGVMSTRPWAAGAQFSMADCAAAPALLYADWVHPIESGRTQVIAYRRKLLARPSYARAVEEARPFRHYFPPGDPKRD
jgi:glutathione S-transferase